MNASGALRVLIDLDPGTERLSGWLTEPDGHRQWFGGWLELASGMERIRRQVSVDATAQPPGSGKGEEGEA